MNNRAENQNSRMNSARSSNSDTVQPSRVEWNLLNANTSESQSKSPRLSNLLSNELPSTSKAATGMFESISQQLLLSTSPQSRLSSMNPLMKECEEASNLSATSSTASSFILDNESVIRNKRRANNINNNMSSDFQFKVPSLTMFQSLRKRPNPVPTNQNRQAKTKFLKNLRSSHNDVNTQSDARSDQTDITLLNSLNVPKLNQTSDQTFIFSIVEGRCNANCEIGIAIIDISTNRFWISQFVDDLLYTRLFNKFFIYHPAYVVLPDTMKNNALLNAFLAQCEVKSKFIVSNHKLYF